MQRHRLDLVSLLCGLVLAGFGLAALVDVKPAAVRWALVWSAVALVAGVAVLISAARRGGAD